LTLNNDPAQKQKSDKIMGYLWKNPENFKKNGKILQKTVEKMGKVW